MPPCLLWLLVIATPEPTPAEVSRLAAPAALSDDPAARQALRQAAERVRAWEKLLSWEATLAPRGDRPSSAGIDAALAAVRSDPAFRSAGGRSWVEPWLPCIERLFDLLFAAFLHTGQVGRGRQATALARCHCSTWRCWSNSMQPGGCAGTFRGPIAR